MRARLGGLLLGLYPEAWRDRYDDEIRSLLEDDPPGARGLLSLVWGAAGAHLRPRSAWAGQLTPASRMRLSVGSLFACWLLVSLAGSSFAKLTENFSPVDDSHMPLSAARDLVTAGAGLGAAAVALGGIPLVWHAVRRARRTGDRRLGALLASPLLAGLALLALGAVLVSVAPARGSGFPASYVLTVLLPITLGVIACTAVGAVAPRAVMRRADPPVALLRLASFAGLGLALAIALVTAGLALYVPELWMVRGAGVEASGPVGLSTRTMLCFSLAAAAGAFGPAMLATARAGRAALTG